VNRLNFSGKSTENKLFVHVVRLLVSVNNIFVVKQSVKFFTQIFRAASHYSISVCLLLVCLLMILSNPKLSAQDNTLYLMPDIPQANQLNPAYFRLCRIYVELPVISSVKMNMRNSGFGFHDVMQRGTGTQSDTYLVNTLSLDRRLKAINFIQTETDIDLLGFGFGLKEWYFTFGISNHTDLLLSYPHDISLITDDYLQRASISGGQLNLNHLGTEMTIWNSIGVSAAKEIRNGLKVGLRLKYLQGMANVISRHSGLFLNYTNDPVALEAFMKYRINASFPVVVGKAPNGTVNRLNFDNSFSNIIPDFIFNGNRGVSIDAGFVYDIDDLTQVSASITDLGFIHWRKNSNSFNAERNDLFNATDLAKFQGNPNSTDLIKAIRDSVSGVFTSSPAAYYTLTPMKIFGGVTRQLLPGLKAGAMTRIEIYNLNVMPSLSLSMNYTPIPPVSASLSYTIMNNKFNQIGAGFALGNRVAQFYFITDNIVLRWTKDFQSSYFWPYNARMVSFRFGINLLFGCRQKDNKFSARDRKDLCPAYR
jgi:Family of unknown function (DUF5723)